MGMKTTLPGLDKYTTNSECSELVECLRACGFSARKTGYALFETDAPIDCIQSAEIAIRTRRLER